MTQLGLDFEPDPLDGKPTDLLFATPESMNYVQKLASMMPRTKLTDGFADLPNPATNYVLVSRALSILGVLKANRLTDKLTTRDLAAFQLLESILLRTDALVSYQVRYMLHIAATASVRKILETRTMLFSGDITVPDNFVPEDDKIPAPAAPVPNVVVKQLPKLGNIYKPKP